MNLNTETNLGKTSSNTTVFMIVKGETCSWMVPTNCNQSMIFKLDLMDQTGFGGDLVNFRVELRQGFRDVKFIGPHKSDVSALLKDTGLDITDPAFLLDDASSAIAV